MILRGRKFVFFLQLIAVLENRERQELPINP